MMPKIHKPLFTALLAGLMVLGAAAAGMTSATAAPPERYGVRSDGDEQARVTVRVIHATRGDGAVDPALQRAGLVETLKKTFKDYTTFRQLDASEAVAKQGETQRLKLPNGADLSYRYLGLVDGFLRVHIDVGGMTSTVKVKDGGLFFQAGRGYKDGMIVLAFSGRAEGAR